MRQSCFALVIFFLCLVSTSMGQTTATYRPLSSWNDSSAVALARWKGEIQNRIARTTPVRADARPQLAGLRPKSVELLEDGLIRKHPKLLGSSSAKARELLLRRVQRCAMPQLRGYMAEAMFLDRHPEWGYVGKPNATQHDVYSRLPGRQTPFNGQVKYHDSGRPGLYVRDMVKDNRAPRFFIPDDHVEPTKTYLRLKAMRLEAVGDKSGAARLWRDYGRVHAIGATSNEIRSATTEAARSVAREKYASYTSLGASLAVSFGPILYSWATGDLSANVAAYQTVRSLSLIGVGIGTDQLLARIGQGALRGGVRGNVIVAASVAIAQTAWLLHEHGWQRAFYQPDFYEEVVGGVSALGLGLAGGAVATGLAIETGPWAPVIGFGAGVITGTIGYLGGKTVTHSIIELVAPEVLRRQEGQMIQGVKESLDRSILALQTP